MVRIRSVALQDILTLTLSHMSTQPAHHELNEYTIDLPTAQERVAAWINPGPTEIDPTQMRAFVVHREDFKEMLEQYDTEFIRLYLGRKHNDETGQMEHCLVMVSADYDKGSDTIKDLIGDVDVHGEPHHYDIYDFSKPCPPICDTSSELFIGEANC